MLVDSFHPDVFSRDYALGPPKELLTSNFFNESLSRFIYEEVVKSWLEDPTLVIPPSILAYPISWFKEPFALLEAMIFMLYGLPNYSSFKDNGFLWKTIFYL